jgi:hypothetical protein
MVESREVHGVNASEDLTKKIESLLGENSVIIEY